MTEFFVGQKVVCVDDSIIPDPMVLQAEFRVKKGEIYTIRAIRRSECYQTPQLLLVEVRNRVIKYIDGTYEAGFNQCRFRPLETKAISIFRKIAQDVTDGKVLEIVG